MTSASIFQKMCFTWFQHCVCCVEGDVLFGKILSQQMTVQILSSTWHNSTRMIQYQQTALFRWMALVHENGLSQFAATAGWVLITLNATPLTSYLKQCLQLILVSMQWLSKCLISNISSSLKAITMVIRNTGTIINSSGNMFLLKYQ